ncbi:MAG: hypothetical protein JO021_14400 [Alphaproteobacteria bacterium]|nr:hypothetical protein [Alphaproteobacteria bacterium]
MDLMHAFLSGRLSAFVATLSTPLADELKPRCSAVVRLAARRAPPHLRERLAEEWSAHLDDTPGTLPKILFALDLLRASRALCRDAETADAEQDTAVETGDDEVLDSVPPAGSAPAPTGLSVATVGTVSGWDALSYWFRQEQAATIGQLAHELQGALEALDSFDGRLRRANAAPSNPALQRVRTRLVDTAAYAFWHFVVQRECMGFRQTGEALEAYRVPAEVRVKMGAFRIPAG